MLINKGQPFLFSPKHIEETQEEVEKVRTLTPIYENGLNTVSPEVPDKKESRDLLLDLMADGEYHDITEIVELLPNGKWVEAMKELIENKFTFDRRSCVFRLRRRLRDEEMPSVVQLVENISEKNYVKTPETVEVTETELVLNEEVLETVEPLEHGMLLSDAPDGLAISASESAVMTAAILAKKGSGKTYLGMVIAECFLSDKLEIPLLIIDPTGVWSPGLRSMADGTPSSNQVLTLGGEYGDFPITSSDGARIADLLLEIRPFPMIVDVSGFAPSEQHEVVAELAQRLFTINTRSPIHVIIDEADEFAPQVSNADSKHHRKSLGAIDRLVRRGRSKGIGVTLITQRSAVISKNVLSQVDTLFVMNMVSPADIGAVEDWMKRSVKATHLNTCLGHLPNLSPGVAYYMCSGANPKFRKFNVRKRLTFDSSRTPKPGEDIIKPVLYQTPEDIMKIVRGKLTCINNTVI